VHEIKHDGYRLIVRKDTNRVRVFTRRGFDFSLGRLEFGTVSSAAMLVVLLVVITGDAYCRLHDASSDICSLIRSRSVRPYESAFAGVARDQPYVRISGTAARTVMCCAYVRACGARLLVSAAAR
jgi:hypothetical protein